MAVYTVLSAADLADALGRFGLPPPDRVVPEPKGYVNTNHHVWAGGARWFLRVAEGKTEADVRFEGEVHAFLASARYPAPRLVPTSDGRPFAISGGRIVMLFAYAPGEEVAPDAVGPEHCRAIGDRLARLHELSEAFTADRPNPFGPARVAAWIAELRRDARADPDVARALPLLEEESRRATALPATPRGLVHGDLFVDNVLWIGERPSAILDWEMACVDAFAWDLGVALCAWCWREEAAAFDAPRAAALLDGYRTRGRLDADTARALPAHARLAALRFTASRILALRAPDPGRDRAPRKDWRPFRDRLAALAAMGDAGLAALAAIPRP